MKERSGAALERIVPRDPSPAPAYRALVQAGLQRARNSARALPHFLRLEILGLAAVSIVLLATYGATSYYDVGAGADPGAPLVTRVSRVLAGSLGLATLVLALLASRVSVRGGDARGLSALPIPGAALAAFRADRLAFLALPPFALGLGLLFYPLQLGHGGISALAVPAWAAWLWAASQIVAALDALCLEGRWGPGLGGIAGRAAVLIAVPAVVLLYGESRDLAGRVMDLTRASSFALTAVMGLGLGAVARFLAVRAGASSRAAELGLAEHLAVRRWRRLKRIGSPGARAGGAPSPRNRVLAWITKDALVARRHPALRGQWLLAFLLLLFPIVVVLRPDAPAWVFAGLLVVLGAAAGGVGVLLLWFHEQPMFLFAAPVPRRVPWNAKAIPALALVLGSALALSAIAWIKANAHTGRILFLWTGVSGLSLVLAAANLGQASPPRSALGQNLYGLGLFSCVLVGSVYPGIGWLVLAAFAGYTLHSLARDPRS